MSKILKLATLADALAVAGLVDGESGFLVVPEYHLEDAQPCLGFRFEGVDPFGLLVALGIVLARTESVPLAIDLARGVDLDEPYMCFPGWNLED